MTRYFWAYRMFRTHDCNSLRKSDIDRQVTLAGWVNVTRDHGGVIFIDMRDREGLTQVVFRPEENSELAKQAHTLRGEDVIQVSGTVAARLPGTENPNLATGDIEIIPSELRILNRADPLPFPLDAEPQNEDLRMTHRYLDLRRPRLARNLRIRHRAAKATRDYLDSQDFVEVETPILSKSTPEGARDFLVPSRIAPGKFYALPQAPQQYKQLLMVAGVEKYFQIAKCFRDEDLRADRQPEFTQIDIEASFVTPEDIFSLTEGLLGALWKDAGLDIPPTFERLSYADVMERYGIDRPDIRYALELFDASDAFRGTEFGVTNAALAAGGRVRGLKVPGGAALSRKQLDEIEAIAKLAGAGGLIRLKRGAAGLEGPAAKFLSESGVQRLAVGEGELCLLVAGTENVSNPTLDRVRQDVAQRLSVVAENKRKFIWVTEFPLFGREQDGTLSSVHHPFTSPHPDDLELLDSAPEKVRALAYDVVLNGLELGGGSIRINDPSLQRKVLSLLGIGATDAQLRFGFLLDALSAGAPPHGGIAFGFDRLTMVLAGATSLRDVIAFPKTTAARALFEGAPSHVPPA